jgi:hypothetical protein
MTTRQPETPEANLAELVGSLLDRGYESAARSTLRGVAGSVQSDRIQTRLDELEREARRLAEEGERLQPDNPVLRTLLDDMEDVMRRNGGRIDGIAPDLQDAGADIAGRLTRQLALPGINDQQLRTIGIRWNAPDPEAVRRLVNYVESEAWQRQIAQYPGMVLDTVRNQAIRGVAEGWGPLRAAANIRLTSEGVPAAQANQMMRTLYLQSYRGATAAHQVANADILTEQIRIAALDSLTCLACISEHGQRLPIGQRINDHENGRCTSITVVRGREREVVTGEQWFLSQPEARQRQIAGPANYEAMRAGRVRLSDFVERYENDVYGEMLRESSLRGVLGRDAATFYQRRQ